MAACFPHNNARTMDFSANDIGYVPSNAPHYIENTDDTTSFSSKLSHRIASWMCR